LSFPASGAGGVVGVLILILLTPIVAPSRGGFKAPERVHFLGELPKGASGKIQRLKLTAITES